MDIVTVIGVEAPGTNAVSTYSNAHLVRIIATTANTLVTRAMPTANSTNLANTTIGTFTALTGQVTWAAKAPTEMFLIPATANVAACAFAS